MPVMQLLERPNWQLLANLARREVRGRYKGSILGLVWTLIVPLVTMVTYTVVFSVLWQVADTPHYWLYLLVGLAFWALFGAAFISGATSLVSNAALITKVPFQRAVLPLSSLASATITMLVMIAIILPFAFVLSEGNPVYVLLLPLVLVAVAMLVIGISLAISVLNVFFRDIEHIVAALLVPWFFLTPIIYNLDMLPQLSERPWLRYLLEYGNIAAPFVISLQDVLYWGRAPSAVNLVYIFIVGGLILGMGAHVFRRLQRDIAVEL